MCQLTDVHYACGHNRKVLLKACMHANRLAGRVLKRAPKDCLTGLEVVDVAWKNEDCGRGFHTLGCRASQAIDLLERRYTEMCAELESFVKRADHIAVFIRVRFEPDCDWEAVRNAGRNVAAFQRDQTQLLTEVIPGSLGIFLLINDTVQRGLHKVYVWQHAEILSRATGKCNPLGSAPCNLTNDTPSDYPEIWALEQYWPIVRGRIHPHILALEGLAVEACLDDVGYGLPDNPNDRIKLESQMASRLLRPATKQDGQVSLDLEHVSLD